MLSRTYIANTQLKVYSDQCKLVTEEIKKTTESIKQIKPKRYIEIE